MKIWAKIINNQRIEVSVVQEFASARPSDLQGWSEVLHTICQQLDLSRPLILSKHLNELTRFSMTSFKKDDFMEPINFDRLELEVLREEKKKKLEKVEYRLY